MYSALHPAAVSGDGGIPQVANWPLQAGLCLGALPGAVPCARLHTKNVLHEWGLKALVDDAEVVVSELVTNALDASLSHASRSGLGEPPMPICFSLSSDGRTVVIQVWDASPEIPTAGSADSDAGSGRGLVIVQVLAGTWNWYQPHNASGKVVWAAIGTKSQAAHRSTAYGGSAARPDGAGLE